MGNELSIRVSAEQGRVPVTVFHVTGEINTNTTDQLQTQARGAFDSGMRNLVLDFSQVPYISSAGLRAIRGGLNERTLQYQLLKGLTATGQIDQATWEALVQTSSNSWGGAAGTCSGTMK